MLVSPATRSLGLACALALCVLTAAWGPAPTQAQPLQPGFSESVVFGGLTEPTDIAFAPDGRVFVSEKSGLIKVFPELNAPSPTIAADLRTQVHNFWDRGLLSIALDPQFPLRPYLYALYSADAAIGGTAPRWGEANATSDGCPTPPGPTDAGCVISTRLVKLTLSGNVVTNEQTLLNDWCQQFPSHSAGGLAFGPDGMLYVSGGDGASFNYTDYGQEGNPCGDPPGGTLTPPTAEGGALRAQDYLTPADPTGLNGSLIRVDPDTGAAAPGNPMSASPDANARRIVAAGMRNPFRFTFRPGTSEIFIGDVGWGSWEEIDRLPKADDATVDNFGWPCYEGVGRTGGYEGAGLNLCKQLYNTPGSVTPPLFTYSHTADVVPGENCTAAGSSISGLAFYQGGAYPAAYKGALFFADYSRRCTWVMFEKNGQPDPSTVTSFLNNNDPVNLEIGPEGDLFVVDFTGSVRRIGYPGGNRAPTAVAVAQPKAGPLPLTVNFDGTGSTDPDAGDVLTYAWDLDGDGQYDDSTAAKPSWTYNSAGSVTVRLRVTDKGGQSATDSIVVGPGNDAPHAQIDTPTTALHWAVGDPISFSGQGSDPQDGTLGAARMSWAVVMRHCHTANDCHSHPIQTFAGVTGGTFTAPDHEYPSYLELRLTVTDSAGLTDTTTLRLDPRTVDLTFRSEPPGLTLGAGQQSAVAPFTQTVIVGSRNSLAAPTPQNQGAALMGFTSWSDGGAATHDVIAPAAATTYTAIFKPESGLVAAYGFEETSGTAVNDSSPAKNNGTAVGGPLSSATGRFGRALSFDGVNDKVEVPDSAALELTNAMTLEAWVKPTTSRLHAPVIAKETSSFYTYKLEAGGEVKGVPEGFISDAPWSWEDAEDTKVLPNGAWSHIALTYDGTNMRFYVNGVLVSTRIAAKPTVDGLKLLIGAYKTTNFYEGLIDEVRIYNRALSAAEIGTDMNTAVVSSGPGDTTPPSQPANLTATGSLGKVTLGWSASTDDVGVTGYEVYRSTTPGFTPSAANRIATPATPGYVDTIAAGTYYYRVKAIDAAGNLSVSSAEATGTSTADTTPPTVSLTAPGAGNVSGTVALKATAADNVGVSGVQFLVDGSAFGAEDTSAPYEIQWPSTGVTNGTHKLAARARDANANTTTSAEVTVTVSNSVAPTGLVAAYGFEETSGTAVNDSSPAKNNGTAVGGPLSSATGRFGRALSFDGVNDKVEVPDSAALELTNAMTLEAWVKPTTSRLHAPVIAKETSSFYTYKLEAGGEVKGVPEGFISDAPWSWEDAEDTKVLPNGAWSHIALTYDGTNMRFYVNGVLVSTRIAAKPTVDGLKLLIGAYKTTNFYEGLIDEVRIYNRALSAAEIGTDMNTAVKP
jgi:glucose/arabinose dehydrogenase